MSRSSSSPYSRRLRARWRLEGHAARMRVEDTASEALLWSRLKGSQLGFAFRRQIVLGEADGKLFVVDFLAPKARLVVEVDGGAHTRLAKRDERRDRVLTRLGYRVLPSEPGTVAPWLNAEVGRGERKVLTVSSCAPLRG